MAEQATDPKTKALEFFKDWSNYLLVTTVAAVGWIGGTDYVFSSAWTRAVCILAFSLSVVFGILTLALIPLVQEQRTLQHASNYDVPARYRDWSGGERVCRLKSLCFPQHLLFLLGILAFALGTIGGAPAGLGKVALWIIEIVVTIALVGAVLAIRSIWEVNGEPWARAESA
jgi:hypothetical protein